jgi:thymidylate synthase ThyX
MHRHRRCIQIGQEFTTRHGYDIPPELEMAGIRQDYEAAMRRTGDAAAKLSQHLLELQSPLLDEEERAWLKRAERGSGWLAGVAQYAIPLGFRKRTLFKMDFAEVVYISELRTGPAGHVSYRNVAYAMYEAVCRKYPALAKYFRVHDVREPVDLLQR